MPITFLLVNKMHQYDASTKEELTRPYILLLSLDYLSNNVVNKEHVLQTPCKTF